MLRTGPTRSQRAQEFDWDKGEIQSGKDFTDFLDAENRNVLVSDWRQTQIKETDQPWPSESGLGFDAPNFGFQGGKG